MMDWYAGIGSRETPPEVCESMRFIAERLRDKFVLRSGNAVRADQAFQSGAGSQLAVYLPWPRYNDYDGPTMYPTEAAIQMGMEYHPAPERLTQGAQKLHGRNMHIILGSNLDQPVKFVICWTPNGIPSGGTLTGIRCAADHGIQVYNLFNWKVHHILERYL